MRITSCGITDVGIKRTNNEDNYLINEQAQLFVVCDGMGGHAGGEYASAIAVNTIEEVIIASNHLQEAHLSQQQDLQPETERLRYALRLASKRIFEKASLETEYEGMGTTAIALWVVGQQGLLAHVGDSRCYRLRAGELEQMTSDHSWVNERIQAGLMSEEEAKTHRHRNVITRSLGYKEEVEIDLQAVDLRPGDRFLLCSDGLSNLIEPHELARGLKQQQPQELVRQLVWEACQRGGDDNITVVVVKIDAI